MTLDEVTKEWLEKEYETKSYQQIADELGTYQMKIVRLAKKLGVQSKSHSEAQSHYLTNTDNHPTKGKKRPEEVRDKISRNQVISYLMKSDEEKKKKKERAKEIWDRKTDEEKAEFYRKGIKGSQLAAKEGSRLEKYLFGQLKKARYKVEQHREEMLPSGKMHLDLFVPELKTIIEVNGIAHYEPVWGDDVLRSTRASDKEKQGILLVNGFVFVEIADLSDRVSQAQMKDMWEQLQIILLKVSTTNLHYHERYFIIKTRFNAPEKMTKYKTKKELKKELRKELKKEEKNGQGN